MSKPQTPRELLRWYLEAGVDEAIGETPVDRYAVAAVAAVARHQPAVAPIVPTVPAPAPSAAAAVQSEAQSQAQVELQKKAESVPTGAVKTAFTEAARAASVEDLRRALESFDACPLKKTATNLVFCDGNPAARIVFIGEAPGADEDRQGVPFIGPSGKLLDRMLASIGLDRTNVLITNTVFWRPPGNRTPTTTELATCLPFVERLIELVDPDVLVALGGAAAKELFGRPESVSRLRGKWFPYSTPGLARPVQATATFHPAYLLRTPARKRDAWHDMLAIGEKLAGR